MNKEAGIVKCPYVKRCGSCKLTGLTYQESLYRKQKYLEKLLKEFGKIPPVIGMENPFHYRNKVHAVFGYEKGRVVSGTYQEGTHRLIPIDACLIEDETADAIIMTLRELLKSFKIRTYDEDTGYGLFRHALIKRGFGTGEIMVVLVTASPVFPSRNNFVKALLKKHPEITTIVHNINERGTSMVLGKRENVLYGKGYIEDVLCGLTFRISAKSFYQVNPVMTEILYKKAISMAGLTGKETVLDAYCGIGTIGLIASEKAGQVIGVELNRDAFKDAIANAKRNAITNERFFCGDAGEFMESLAAEGQKLDVVIMDPPRSGSTQRFIDAVAAVKAGRVVYISCGPESLARDLQYFKKKGYAVKEIQGVDLFGWTGHVETCVLLSHEKNKSFHVTVEMDVDSKYLLEKKPTYKEIRDYVFEHYGFSVNACWIADTKRSCGLEVHEPYHKAYSPKKTRPCPPDKEKAIKEAFVHFKLI